MGISFFWQMGDSLDGASRPDDGWRSHSSKGNNLP